MYHSRSAHNVFLAAILSIFSAGGVCAEEGIKISALPGQPIQNGVSISVKPLPLPPPQSKLKTAPVTVELYQHDEEPIGNRKPLLMVHGLRGEFKEGFRWDRVCDEFTANPEFRQRFKIYYARFNTYTLLGTVKPHFKKTVRDLYQAVGNRPITIVALSMGGNLIQESMEDDDVASIIERVMTLGTPFHGSPLFCFDWLRYSIIQNHRVPWVRGDLALSYLLYFKRHPNLIEDLRWDDSDRGIPNVGKFSTWYPFHIKGDLTVSRWSNPRLLRVNNHLKVDKSKFICYGGYLLTDYVLPHKTSPIWKTIRWPYSFMACTVPYHMGFEHPVLRALNYEMGRMLVAGPQPSTLIHGSSRYSLNDGITPLTSALFLPSEALASTPVNRESEISHIRKSIDVGTARVFRQIDHLTFVDGYRPDRLPPLIRDELAPEMGEKTVFDWMLYDLLRGDSAVAGSGQDNLTNFSETEPSAKGTPEARRINSDL